MVVSFAAAAERGDEARAAVDGDHRIVGVQRDAVPGIPRRRMGDDVGRLFFTAEHGREQDAVVIADRFCAEDREFVALRSQAQQLFEEARAGHAVADHHEPGSIRGHGFLLCGWVRTSTMPSNTRTGYTGTASAGSSRQRPSRKAWCCL